MKEQREREEERNRGRERGDAILTARVADAEVMNITVTILETRQMRSNGMCGS